ncbi:MAG TPA: amidohydrolase family protein [Acidimicrobiales bacterium]|jgi:predicted TIM-barrel fold metal-dependent hydrolase|nr:amidohydrolase family protein [Acidimicrobiales bacterium]
MPTATAARPFAGLKVIDVDAHITEPDDLWTSRAPAAYRDRVPTVVEVDGTRMWSLDGVVIGRAGGGSVIRNDGQKTPGTEFMRWQPGTSHHSAWDMDARVEVLDALGIYAQVIYPNAAGFGSQKFGEVQDDELRRLCASIYNEAMIEAQERSGGRILPMGLLPWWDIEGSVAETHRVAAAGFRGVNICSDPQNRGLPDLGERDWDPLWEACCEHALPLNFHIGASNSSLTWFGESPWPSQDDERKLAIGSAMMYLSNARVIANLVYSGVLDRFPQLKIVSVESGIGWIPFFLEALDYQQLESAPHSMDNLSMKPSDYFRRQIYGCFWFERLALPLVIEAIGVDKILFETDYPHPTCLYPDPLERVEAAFAGIGETERRKILQDNAAALYRIELDG